jgi:acylphosphatase
MMKIRRLIEFLCRCFQLATAAVLLLLKNRSRGSAGEAQTGMADVYYEQIYFSGHVQGVGFRYQTLQVAREFEVGGFVRNLVDGRVELQAEGEAGEVRAFTREVESRLDVYIRKAERTAGTRPSSGRGFTIA